MNRERRCPRFDDLVAALAAPPYALSSMAAFAIIRILYLGLVAGVPLLGAAFLAATWRRRAGPRGSGAPRRLRILAWASLALPAIGIYASFIEPFRLVTETVRVVLPSGRSGSGELRIAVFSDLQTDRVTGHERGAVDLVLALRPDLILLPGDFFQGTPEEFRRELPALRDLLGRLRAPAGVFAVEGNTDVPSEMRMILEGTGIRLLEDEVVRIAAGDRTVTIGGIGARRGRDHPGEAVRRLEDEPGEGDIRILLSHHPDAVLGLRPGTRIDLVVAGHTHGGQVQLPWFGPPITLSGVPRRVAAGGLHDLDGRLVYVSRGVGVERGAAPRIRFLCPPEISLLVVQ
jgi:predicted MPP superfamily phosphohydrolase